MATELTPEQDNYINNECNRVKEDNLLMTSKGEYYQKKYIQHLIRESTKSREVGALGKGNIRALKIKNLFDFERILKLINWEEKRQNLYRSVAKLKEIPEFTFNPKNRSSETGAWFEEKFDNLVYEYDLFVDWDCEKIEDINKVLKEVKELKSFFDEREIPYYLLFSGKKGFHLYIDGKYMPKPEIREKYIYPHKEIAERIKEAFDFKYLDLRNNGVPNRLCKIPYSLVDGNIALPLDDKQIENFKIEDMQINKVLYNVKPLIRRGLLERFPSLTEIQKKKNVQKFIKEIMI